MMPSDHIAFADNTVGEEEIESVTAVLRSRWLSAGPVCAAFEAEFAAALGVPDAVAVSSGTAALHLAVLALDLRPGDEVIMPSLSFVAGAAMVALHGGRPVFADIRSADDLTIDPGDAARRVTRHTRAIMVMHYGGHAADIAQVAEVAADARCTVIEDAAHAPAVTHPAGMLGTVGDVGCFSFFATKNITTGEGGMVVARDARLLDRIRAMRSHHTTSSAWLRHQSGTGGYDVTGIGLNYRPNEIAAALGRTQLARLADDRRRRAQIAARYRAGLADLPGLQIPFLARSGDCAHHLFAVLVPPPQPRAEFVARLREAGVPTSVHYPPTHQLSFYREHFPSAAPLPRLEAIAGRLVSLPMHARLSDEQADRVVASVRSAVPGWSAGRNR